MKSTQARPVNKSSQNKLIFRLFFIFCFTAFLSSLPLSPAKAEGVEKKLTLTESIEIALKNATTTQKAANNKKLQSADVLRSYGSFLPTISVSAGYTPKALSRSYSPYNYSLETSKIKTETESANLSVTTSLNIFNGFRDYASLKSALAREHSAEYTLSRVLQSVAFDVTQAYYQVLLDQELFDIAKENLISTNDQLTLTNKQFQIGLKSMIDRYQQQAEASQSSLSVIKAETRLQRSKLELLRKLQIDPATKLILEPLPVATFAHAEQKNGTDSTITHALDDRFDLKSMKNEVAAAKWQITRAKAAWYPRIDLTLAANTSATTFMRQTVNSYPPVDYFFPSLSDQIRNAAGYSVGLNLSWSIFDGFQTSYNVQSAKINHLNQQFDFEDLKYNIIIDSKQAENEYRSAFVQIGAAKVSLEAARLAFEGVKKKHDLGAASFIELSTARSTLFSAQSNLTQATYNLALQKNILDFTNGSIQLH
jgi:outer membrane protein